MSKKENFFKGFVKENPVFVFLLGMCPALGVSSTVEAALGMGILVIFVLALSNAAISLMKNLIPDDVRIPAYIVIIASFVTIVEMLTNAYAPELAVSLGVFIPLIVVNCIILGRAESFASKNNLIDSVIDGVGMGIGFTGAVVIIGFIREVLATGAIGYGVYLPLPVTGEIRFWPEEFGISFFQVPAGAFLVLGSLLAFFAYKRNIKEAKLKAIAAEAARIAREEKAAALAAAKAKEEATV